MDLLEREDQVVETQHQGWHQYGGVASVGQMVSRAFSAQWSVEEHEGGWTVTDTATGIFGSGEDVTEAMRDLFAALHEHCDVLQRQPQLSEALARQLDYLQRVLP
jgi:hypothetical protein